MAPNVGEFVAMRRTTTELSYNKPETNKFRNRTINEIRKESSSSAKKKSRQYCNCNRKPPLSRKNREKTSSLKGYLFKLNIFLDNFSLRNFFVKVWNASFGNKTFLNLAQLNLTDGKVLFCIWEHSKWTSTISLLSKLPKCFQRIFSKDKFAIQNKRSQRLITIAT